MLEGKKDWKDNNVDFRLCDLHYVFLGLQWKSLIYISNKFYLVVLNPTTCMFDILQFHNTESFVLTLQSSIIRFRTKNTSNSNGCVAKNAWFSLGRPSFFILLHTKLLLFQDMVILATWSLVLLNKLLGIAKVDFVCLCVR